MFRTEIKMVDKDPRIGLTTPVLSIGSCFADAMGDRFLINKFKALVNPFGVIFNPVSICRILDASIENAPELLFTFTYNQDTWFSFHAHSELSGQQQAELETLLSKKVHATHSFLKSSEFLIITLGTALVYRLKESNEVVANCHKVPAPAFVKSLLSTEEVTGCLKATLERLFSLNPALKVILTVSPVRHIKDTLPTNTVSKSVLRLASHYLSEEFASVSYFPSFEIMMDDLRDYRFYKEDMIHPTSLAEEYIWDRFQEAYITNEARAFIKEWASVRKALEHKPFRPESDTHKKFIKSTIERLKELSLHADMQTEIKLMESRL